MLTYELLADERIVIVTPGDKLSADDFEALTDDVDHFIETGGALNGLMIDARSFPGWKDFAALVAHLKFVRDHHRQIGRVAAVTDGRLLSLMPRIADHFVAAEIRHFDYDDRDEALDWLVSS